MVAAKRSCYTPQQGRRRIVPGRSHRWVPQHHGPDSLAAEHVSSQPQRVLGHGKVLDVVGPGHCLGHRDGHLGKGLQ
eukprot:scaffold678039_cov47-Prasinocladus_malaysianus.AAC.1